MSWPLRRVCVCVRACACGSTPLSIFTSSTRPSDMSVYHAYSNQMKVREGHANIRPGSLCGQGCSSRSSAKVVCYL